MPQNAGPVTDLTKTQSNYKISNLYSRMHVWDDLDYATDPLVTGYSFVHFQVPAGVFSNGGSGGQGAPNIPSVGTTTLTEAETWLSANCYSISLPDINVSTVEVEGMQGQWISMPGRLDIGSKTTTATYWETYNVDITQIIRQWVYTIRDPRTGSSVLNYAGLSGGAAKTAANPPIYRSKTFKGYIYWFMTDPALERIIIAAEFLGAWPTKVPYSAINTDIKTSDKVELSVDYAFDNFYVYPGTIQKMASQQAYWKARANHNLALLAENGDGTSPAKGGANS